MTATASNQTDTARRAEAHLWPHFSRLSAFQTESVPVITRGEGAYIYDEAGRRYLDGLSGLFVVQAGHGRQELADKEKTEIEVIEAYLPQAASQDEIEGAVTAAISETGASSMKDMGKVMKAVQAALAGKNADGRRVSEIVKAKLGG